MARIEQTFDPNTVPPSDRSFELLPVGWYDAQIIESDETGTRADQENRMINVTWELMESPFGKRRVWDRVNYKNKSAKAMEIGQRRLADMLLAMGLPSMEDTNQLHYIPCAIRVGVEKDETGQYEPKNKVTGVAPYQFRPGMTLAPVEPAPRPNIPGRVPPSQGAPQRAVPPAAQGAPPAARPAPVAPAAPPPRQAGPRPAGSLPWSR